MIQSKVDFWLAPEINKAINDFNARRKSIEFVVRKEGNEFYTSKEYFNAQKEYQIRTKGLII